MAPQSADLMRQQFKGVLGMLAIKHPGDCRVFKKLLCIMTTLRTILTKPAIQAISMKPRTS